MAKLKDIMSNAAGSDLVDSYNEQINKLTADIAKYEKEASDYSGAYGDWMEAAYDDWKYADKSYRRAKFRKNYSTFLSMCRHTDMRCLGAGETGRGSRFDDRYKKAIAYYKDYLARTSAVATLKQQLTTAQGALVKAEEAARKALAAGKSQEQADALAQAELDKIQAETEKILADTNKAISEVKTTAETNPNTKYIIMGVIGLVALGGFLLYKRVK